MKSLLVELFQKSIRLGDVEYSAQEIESVWIGNPPANVEHIEKIEQKFKIILPEDYKKLLLVANGFKAPNGVEPSFLSIEKIDYLKNISPFLIECYEDSFPELEDCILIAGKDEEQQFLLLPPKNQAQDWRYWKFANWIPGVEEYNNLEDYFKTVIDSLEN